MDRTHLEVFDSFKDGKSYRATRLTWDSRRKPIEIFHELDRVVPFSENTPLDGHVLIVLLFAASLGKPLLVHGPMTRVGLRNIGELLLVWSRWRRDRYARIDVLPQRIIDARCSKDHEPTIAAFSGGVDATFLALQHTKPAFENRRAQLRLQSALMVHGFDVDVYNFAQFNKLTARVGPLLESLKLDLRTMRTNSRDLRLQDWDDSCGLELAGCMHMYGDEFEYGLIGSSEPYEKLRMPWGTSPITDGLMSGGLLKVVHDGAGYSRTDKVAEIARNPVACKMLKVCWAGADQAENCGHCEKCVRTRLNFLAAGTTATPQCFPDAFDVDLIRKIPIHNHVQKAEMELILQHATEKNLSGEWLNILEARISTWRPPDTAELERQKHGGPIKRAAVRLADVMGVSEPAKRAWRPVRRAFLKASDRRGPPGMHDAA